MISQDELEISIQTDDPTKAGDIKGKIETKYPLVLFGQIGPHYKNRVYLQFDIIVKDYCWVTKIMENPIVELNQELLYDRYNQIEVMQQLVQPFNEFTDTISENIYIPKAITSYSDYTITHDRSKDEEWEAADSYYGEIFPDNYGCGTLNYYPKITEPEVYKQDLSSTSKIIKFYKFNNTFTSMGLLNTDRYQYFISMEVSFKKYPDYPKHQHQHQVFIGKCMVTMLLMP